MERRDTQEGKIGILRRDLPWGPDTTPGTPGSSVGPFITVSSVVRSCGEDLGSLWGSGVTSRDLPGLPGDVGPPLSPGLRRSLPRLRLPSERKRVPVGSRRVPLLHRLRRVLGKEWNLYRAPLPSVDRVQCTARDFQWVHPKGQEGYFLCWSVTLVSVRPGVSKCGVHCPFPRRRAKLPWETLVRDVLRRGGPSPAR